MAGQITWGDLILAALIGFVAAPLVMFALGLALNAVLPDHAVTRAIVAVTGLAPLIAPVAILGAVPGVLIAGGLRRIGLVGWAPIGAAGAALAALPGVAEPEMLPVLAIFGCGYAGLCWSALRLLRADLWAEAANETKMHKVSGCR